MTETSTHLLLILSHLMNLLVSSLLGPPKALLQLDLLFLLSSLYLLLEAGDHLRRCQCIQRNVSLRIGCMDSAPIPPILGKVQGVERKLSPYGPRVGLNSCASMKGPESSGSALSDQATLFSPPGVWLPVRNKAVPAQRYASSRGLPLPEEKQRACERGL